MMEPTVPWWRRALEFALGGIRSGFARLRRNGKAEAENASEAGPAANRREASNQETPVKDSSPQSELVASKEVVAAKNEPAATVAARTAEEPAPEPPAAAKELPTATMREPEIPSAPTVAPAEQAPEEARPTEFAPADSIPVEATDETVAAETPEAAAELPKETTLAPEAQAVEAEQPVANTMAAETSAIVESQPVAIAAEAAPQEAIAPEEPTAPEPAEEPASPAAEQSEPTLTPAPETAPLAESLAHESATAPPESEMAPTAEPAAPPAPEPPSAPAPQQDIAPTLPFAEKPQRTTAEKVAAALKARGEDAEQSPFSVMVNQVYDGPLDLLLDLIRKQDIDIYDIPIAKITAQFLAYVDQLRASDMDVAGEFIYTAALLIHIKSKMLLPRAPAGPDDAAEDPRREMVERLLEHERFKNAAQMLLEKQMLEAATWTNPGIREFQEDTGTEPEIAADTTDLVRVFSTILERARNRPIIDVEEDSVTVGQMIQFLARRLTMEDRPVALRRLLSHTRSERALIAMFLALLELVRLQAILLRQDRHFSEIFIKKHTGFDALMNQGLADARDDWR
jgi:segregation and condensation protein A